MIDRYLFDEPLLLIGEDGANLITRSTPIAFIASGKYWVNNHAHVLDCMNLMDIKYLMYYINAISLADYVTGTAQPKMNQEKMNSIPVAVPPLAEQKRIVAKLEEILPLVEKYGKAQEELDKLNKDLPQKLRQSILQDAIQGKLVPQDPAEGNAAELLAEIRKEKELLVKEGKLKKKDLTTTPIADDEKPFEIPSSWTFYHLEDLVAILDGMRRPVSKEARESGIYPYYGANGILDYVKEYIFDGEYILVGEDGSVITKTGNPVVNKANGKIWVNNHAHILQECGKLGYYNYLFYALQAIDIRQYIHGFMPKYSQGDLRKTIIPLPPLAEQKRIVAKIEELFAEIDKLK